MGWVCQRQGPDEGCKRIITLCADAREQSRGGLHPSTTDKRIFSEQNSLSSMTQDNPRARIAADYQHGSLPWVTVADPGLGTAVGASVRNKQIMIRNIGISIVRQGLRRIH